MPTTYSGVHVQLKRERGPARSHACARCGGQAKQWAYDHSDPCELRHVPRYEGDTRSMPFSLNLNHYVAVCVPCHRIMDGRSKSS